MTMTLFQVKQTKLEEIIKNNEILFGINPKKDCKYLNIDKVWDAIRFLLNRIDAHSILSQAIPNKQIIGNYDKYGVYEVNYNSVKQAKDIYINLVPIKEQQLKKAFDIKAMNEQNIYMAPFDNSEFEYILKIFTEIQDFYNKAMKNENAIISYIS
ncbi:MAG: YfbM family protein [Marinifilaceae bacterium]|nr:YfbM family protein [Marinifilaceae bacterium]